MNFLTKIGEAILTPFRGIYYKSQFENSVRLNHTLKRQVIDLTLDRDQWQQRFLHAMEAKK